MRLHVIGLPHTSTTKAYSTCAYTEKTRKFATMMHRRGHTVYLYGGPENEAECTWFLPCITKAEQQEYGFNGPEDYLKIDFNAEQPWERFNRRVIRYLRHRIDSQDIICVITSYPTKAIAEAFPNNLVVEYGVGYQGICHPYRVFESYAWRNYVYGKNGMDGSFYDEVIPNFFEVEDFPLVKQKDDYYLFIGRLNANKGLNIAQDVCQRLGRRLVVAGPGNFSGYGEYVGVVGPERRAELMGHAAAVFVPTMYVPPFEGVHVEAMLCGTPVITTDFGVFSETVLQGVDGYRCKNLAEFMAAADKVKDCNPDLIHNRAVRRFSTEVIAEQYERYFERLSTLYGEGFYANV